MKKNENAIIVKNMTKKFKLFYDKPTTLKERLVFWNHKKAETRTVLARDISIGVSITSVYLDSKRK